MHLLIGLTYYRPYTSGLTIYAAREACALARRGHEVTVLTSRYDDRLPSEETLDGVKVFRSNVWFRVGKGPVMPGMWVKAISLLRQADGVNLHLPQFDAAPLAMLARLIGKRIVITYHCDLVLPGGLINRIANWVSDLAAAAACSLADAIVQDSRDYAEHSPFLRRYLAKVGEVIPPIEVECASAERCQAFRQKHQLAEGAPLIGMAARLASEKGVEVVAQALPLVLERYPQARVIFSGPYQNVPGEEDYARRVLPLVERLGSHWKFLGRLDDDEMGAFFGAIDMLLLPSLNSTESFGMVQVEAMACGTPVIASDLPGVRVPVRETGMGEVIRRGDPRALADAILRLLEDPARYRGDPSALLNRTRSERVAEEYERLFSGALPDPQV